MTHLNVSDWPLHSKAQQNHVWLVIMQCCTNASVSGSVSANTNLNLAADVVPHRCDWIKYIKYYSAIFGLLKAAFKIHLAQKSEEWAWHLWNKYYLYCKFAIFYDIWGFEGECKTTLTVKMCWNFLDFSNTPSSLSPVNIYRQISHSINQS